MSNRKCCVPGCVNSEGANECPLHKFPNPERKDLFNTWLYAVGGDILQLENEHIFKYRRVCHLHFEEKYLCRNNRLSYIAVPTKNMPGLSPSKFTTSERRVLSSIQTQRPSTSKEAAALHVQSSHQGSIEDIKIKENIDPIVVPPCVQSTELPLCSQSTVPTVPTDPIAVPPCVQSSGLQLHTRSTEQVTCSKSTDKCNKVGKISTSRQKHLKKVAVTDAEHAVYNKLHRVVVKLSKCRNKIKKQTMKIKMLQNIMTNPEFQKILENLSSAAKIFTILQFREIKKKDKGHRFTLKEKIMALTLMKQSPKGYRYLRKIFVLPSRQTLIKLLHTANVDAGINKNLFIQIKKATEKMKIEHRLCIVLFDEMSLKPNVAYNERKDKVSGFVTNGDTIQPDYADHAQVFMIRGLIKNYKQPVAYTFSQSATKGPELAKQLKLVISHLQEAGLIVVATVCDQGTNNVNCIKYLLQETRCTLLKRGKEVRGNIILLNEQEIIPLYDPPHLMKCIRNNLISKNLTYQKESVSKTAKWSHITSLYKENPGYKGIRLIPKLTESHCEPSKVPRMKVKYATQLFSKTVASNMGYLAGIVQLREDASFIKIYKGILPEESKETADLLLLFDNIFDSVNGSFGKRKKHGKPLLSPATPTSIHHKTWKESIEILKTMKFVHPETGKSESVPTINNWLWTLEGIQMLLKNLEKEYGVTSVWLRHLNQDPLENFFGSIRSHGCRNVNPTAEKFESAFSTLLVNNLSSVHAPGANCEIDNCFVLHEVLITGSEGSKEPDVCEIDNIPNVTLTPLENKNDPREIAGLQYVSGYFLKNIKKKVFKGCDQCKRDLFSLNESEYLQYREYASKKWLCCPSDSLINCISNLQDINREIIKTYLNKKNLKELITTIILMYLDFDFIKCDTHKDKLIFNLIKISCRFFIYNYCKEINNILANKRECDDDEDSFKIKAKKLAKKCFKRKI